MKRFLRKLTVCISFLLLSTTVAALTPEQIAAVIEMTTAEAPDTIVLEVDMERRRGGKIVSVETNGGTEYYIAVETLEILERERDHSGRGERRITDQIFGDARILDLAAAYGAVLEYLAQHDRYARFDGDDFSSIEYDIEFGQLIVEVSFEGSAGDLEIYFDPVTAAVLESEWDE